MRRRLSAYGVSRSVHLYHLLQQLYQLLLQRPPDQLLRTAFGSPAAAGKAEDQNGCRRANSSQHDLQTHVHVHHSLWKPDMLIS
eukprot:COSAG02_NODE_6253_length_3699_cov_1.362222_3_plen_84_part_00